ncbi:MAG: hypothetical protein CVV25_02835 [Ignavibacteriae bacterium HGW-Ignavibacteriae-4]|jgi:heat shock protein HslJ|nr:MAG: hypothetical protein CVV25_02835 [Ignavibacteriae bacterium HGW-Ignavibacteriae-4]
MKKLLYLLMAVMIFTACKDPNTGPGEPQEDAGFIQFESPAVGQKSSFVHFYAKGYWEATPSPISYTRDTIYWEITKQINRVTFEITERLSGDYFGDEANNQPLRIITLFKDSDKVLLVTERTTSSPLLGYKDTVSLPLGNAKNVPFMDWRVGEMNSTAAYDGYVSDYKVKGKEYDRLDVSSDFTPTHYDGMGLLFAYNSKYGMVRHYGMNPWLGDVSGFDLISDLIKPTDELKEFVGTKWRLKNVYYKDGSVKSINEITSVGNLPGSNNFVLDFISNDEIHGISGCNGIKYKYKLDQNKIEMNFFGGMTYVYCPFTGEFPAILDKSTTYKATESTLIINSDHDEYSGLEFERVFEREEYPLENTKWQLRNVHYPSGEIVPIEKILVSNGSNTTFNHFLLDFKENNLLSGFSGCNTYGGTYKIEQNTIEIVAGSITEVGCKFSADYDRILNNSTTFMADAKKLVIYSSLDNFKALEFERAR